MAYGWFIGPVVLCVCDVWCVPCVAVGPTVCVGRAVAMRLIIKRANNYSSKAVSLSRPGVRSRRAGRAGAAGARSASGCAPRLGSALACHGRCAPPRARQKRHNFKTRTRARTHTAQRQYHSGNCSRDTGRERRPLHARSRTRYPGHRLRHRARPRVKAPHAACTQPFRKFYYNVLSQEQRRASFFVAAFVERLPGVASASLASCPRH